MRIGEVADAVGLSSQTLRFYERQGLLPPPERGSNGYRTYDPSILTRLEFIRSSQAAGLTLVEIGSVLDVRDRGDVPCSHVNTLLTTKLRDVRNRLRELGRVESELVALVGRGQRLDPRDCSDRQICHILAPGTDSAAGGSPGSHDGGG